MTIVFVDKSWVHRPIKYLLPKSQKCPVYTTDWMKDFLRRLSVPMMAKLVGGAGHEEVELHDGEVVNKTLLKICNITRPSVARNIQINLFSSPENS